MTTPDLDPKATAVRGLPVWSLDEWAKHHMLLTPMEAIRTHASNNDTPPPTLAEIKTKSPTITRYIRDRLCTACQGEGSPRDPRIVGCRVYGEHAYCPLWPYRQGKNPTRQRAALAGVSQDAD